MVARPSSVRYPVPDSRSDSSAGDPTEYTLFRMSDAEPILQPSAPNRVRLQLELLDERRFGSGVVYLRYRTQT